MIAERLAEIGSAAAHHRYEKSRPPASRLCGNWTAALLPVVGDLLFVELAAPNLLRNHCEALFFSLI